MLAFYVGNFFDRHEKYSRIANILKRGYEHEANQVGFTCLCNIVRILHDGHWGSNWRKKHHRRN